MARTTTQNRARTGHLLVVAYALIVLAWVFGNPPGAAPDEYPHYLRAVAAGHGQLLGDEVATRGPASFNTREQLWGALTERAVVIPAGLALDSFGCNRGDPSMPATCDGHSSATTETRVTNVGTYPPAVYVAPGIVMRLAGDAGTALVLGRLAIAALCVLLLGLAVRVLGTDEPVRLAGLVVATTPMVLFTSSTLSASGPEITAAICYTAALLRLSRDAETHAWGVATFSGVVLAVSRPLGPLWVVFGLAVLLVLRPALWSRAHGPGLVALAIAASSTVAWEILVEPGPPGAASGGIATLVHEATRLPAVMRQGIGKFGYLDTPMPAPAYALWVLTAAALVAFAFGVATRRQRGVLAMSIAGCTLITLLIAVRAAVDGPGQSYMQARWVLPAVVAVPLLSGEILAERRHRVREVTMDRLVLWCAVSAAFVHTCGWLANARRHAVGVDGPIAFLGTAEWSPPLGFLPWLALVLAGAVALAASGRSRAREQTVEETIDSPVLERAAS